MSSLGVRCKFWGGVVRRTPSSEDLCQIDDDFDDLAP